MGKAKGSMIIFIRDELRKKNLEQNYLAMLTPEEKDVYARTMAISWLEVEMIDKLYSKAAQTLYPKLTPQQAVEQSHEEMVKNHASGIYRFFIRILNTDSIIKQGTKVWRQYNDTGDASFTKLSPHSAIMKVANYPNMHDSLIHSTVATLKNYCALAGQKNIKIVSKKNNDGFELQFSWE